MDTDDSSLAFGLLAVTETCLSATCLLRHVYGIRTRHEWSALSYACRACFGGYLAVSAASCVGLAYGGRTASVLELAVCVIGSLLYYMLACLTMVFADEERLPARDYRCNQCFWSLVTCLVFLLHTVLIVDQLYAVPATSSTTLVLHTLSNTKSVLVKVSRCVQQFRPATTEEPPIYFLVHAEYASTAAAPSLPRHVRSTRNAAKKLTEERRAQQSPDTSNHTPTQVCTRCSGREAVNCEHITCNMDARFLLLVLFSVGCAQLRPTKPLDQSPGEIALSSWFLFAGNRTDSGGGGGGAAGDEAGNRRITPKSIFTVRPFSPDILPPCAEGYRSDPMGRCISFVKVDQNTHLSYLVEKFNIMFDEEDYGDEVDEPEHTTAGPLQINIPFGQNLADSDDTDQNDTATFEQAVTVGNASSASSPDADQPPSVPDGFDDDLVRKQIENNATIQILINDLLRHDELTSDNNFTLADSNTALNLLHHKHIQDRDVVNNHTPPVEVIPLATNLTKYDHANVPATEVLSMEEPQNETQALFFLLNVTETTPTNDNVTHSNTEMPELADTSVNHREQEFLPIPLDDEIKIDRFLSSYVRFPDEASSGDYKTSFFHSRLTGDPPLAEEPKLDTEVAEVENLTAPHNLSDVRHARPSAAAAHTEAPNKEFSSHESANVAHNRRVPAYSHRNRDRNLFSWLSPPSQGAAPTAGSVRTSSKLYAPSGIAYVRTGSHQQPYGHKISQRDFDRLFRTQPWNSR